MKIHTLRANYTDWLKLSVGFFVFLACVIEMCFFFFCVDFFSVTTVVPLPSPRVCYSDHDGEFSLTLAKQLLLPKP